MDLSEIKDAIAEITSKDSQSAILKSLISNASKFTPRGAFFIVKNEHFVGWKVFGGEADDTETAIRDIHFPMSDDSILNAATQGQSMAEGSFGTYNDDAKFLDPLQFGRPDRMYAIPLVARGRGVAVLYTDYGNEGVSVNTDALEMLVRVAGLTVEMLAAGRSARAGVETPAQSDFSETQDDAETAPVAYTDLDDDTSSEYSAPSFESSSYEEVAETVAADEADTAELHTGDFGMAPEYVPDESPEEPEPEPSFAPVDEHPTPVSSPESLAFESFQIPATDLSPADEPETGLNEAAIVFDSAPVEEAPEVESSPFDQHAEKFEPSVVGAERIQTNTAPAVETVTSSPRTARLSDRNVDLPIEVAEDERRLHNDARRFARLLVSEIKLYNEKKVQEGREASDLYERLREAIDRSREMYDKRVQPPVASKFDYFHFELINALADGDIARLGQSYPGATI
jgi:hypothetical protein